MSSVLTAIIGQSLRVNATIAADLTDALTVAIKYKTPSGTTGSIAATIDDAAGGLCHVDIPGATLSAAGDWHFMAEATFAGGVTVKTFGKRVTVVAEFVVVVP